MLRAGAACSSAVVEDRKRSVSGQVFQDQGCGAGDAGAQRTHCLAGNQGLAADHAMRIGKAEAHHIDFVDPLDDLLRSRRLLGAPQSVPRNEIAHAVASGWADPGAWADHEADWRRIASRSCQ